MILGNSLPETLLNLANPEYELMAYEWQKEGQTSDLVGQKPSNLQISNKDLYGNILFSQRKNVNPVMVHGILGKNNLK